MPATIRQEDGTRDVFEKVFQAMDSDDCKEVPPCSSPTCARRSSQPPPCLHIRSTSTGSNASSVARCLPAAAAANDDPAAAASPAVC